MSNIISKKKALQMNANRWGTLTDRYPWEAMQSSYDNGKSLEDISLDFNVSKRLISKGARNGLFVKRPREVSKEARDKISKKRKEWLANNPDKHPWRSKDKFKSKPCENVKAYLNKLNVLYVEEYTPEIPDRYFSIDIALPDKMIALEINGNQHYEKDGTLKPYYQERHDLLESMGWAVYEIHYSACYSMDKWTSFIDKIKFADSIVEFDYFNYVPKTRALNKCCDCGCDIYIKSKRCMRCNSKIDRIGKIIWPDKEELYNMVWEYPSSQLSKMLGVSDVAIAKRCKKYNISKPPRGYWMIKKAGEIGLEPT